MAAYSSKTIHLDLKTVFIRLNLLDVKNKGALNLITFVVLTFDIQTESDSAVVNVDNC